MYQTNLSDFKVTPILSQVLITNFHSKILCLDFLVFCYTFWVTVTYYYFIHDYHHPCNGGAPQSPSQEKSHMNDDFFDTLTVDLHRNLQNLHVQVSLSNVRESLALALNFQSLDTLHATLKNIEKKPVTDIREIMADSNNQFVFTSKFDPAKNEIVDYIYPPGTTLTTIKDMDWRELDLLEESLCENPITVDYTKVVVVENFSIVPAIYKNGLHDGAIAEKAAAWVREFFVYRTPIAGVKVSVREGPDNGETRDHLLVWIDQDEADKIRSLFTSKIA